MTLPLQVQQGLVIPLEGPLEVQSEYFASSTPYGGSVVVRFSEEVIGVYFEIHPTPTTEAPNAKTVLVRAEEAAYGELLRQALSTCEITLPYFKLEWPGESAP